MTKENIELHIIHKPELMPEDNGFGIAIFIDGADKSVLELSQEQMLHIGAILLNASRKFINNANKIEPKDYSSIDPHFGKPIERKDAWSEEDDEHLERILKELGNQRQRPINSPYLDKIESDYNWLKFLKDRVQLKQKKL